jgi:hypothetical protein
MGGIDETIGFDPSTTHKEEVTSSHVLICPSTTNLSHILLVPMLGGVISTLSANTSCEAS